nr:PREDICTED: uncharacterized protein LOC102351586 [Latimeria chalumnae]|eukprot:XP_005999298.1 PREDICTED: uncharacterized protein LOC102351586 [Latimeria chalumnae]
MWRFSGILTVSLVVASVSGSDACLHLHTEGLNQPNVGEDVELQCHFQFRYNFTMDQVYVLWGREVIPNEYMALVIFDGQNVKTFREDAIFSADALKHGKANLLLRKVSANETGTYLCDITVMPVNSKIKLQMQVKDPEDPCRHMMKDNHSTETDTIELKPGRYSYGIIIAFVFLTLFGLTTVAYVIYKKTSITFQTVDPQDFTL